MAKVGVYNEDGEPLGFEYVYDDPMDVDDWYERGDWYPHDMDDDEWEEREAIRQEWQDAQQ